MVPETSQKPKGFFSDLLSLAGLLEVQLMKVYPLPQPTLRLVTAFILY